MTFENKVVLITGASSGIGRELARQLSKENCFLALLARRIDLLTELEQQLLVSNSSLGIYQCDVSKKSEVQEVIKQVKERFGRIDIAILNAGVGSRSAVNEFNSDKAKFAFDVNVLGITNCVEAVLPDFIESKSGMIVGVSSLADSRGWPGSGFYAASKAAATTLLESLRIEAKKYNVKVITVKPGFVRTAMTANNKFPMPFLMDVEKAASIIINGMKKEKRIIQFPLFTVLGSKLIRIIPDFLFEYFAAKGSHKISN